MFLLFYIMLMSLLFMHVYVFPGSCMWVLTAMMITTCRTALWCMVERQTIWKSSRILTLNSESPGILTCHPSSHYWNYFTGPYQYASSSTAYLRNNHNSYLMDICFLHVPTLVCMISLQNFAHGMTAELSCHEQNFIAAELSCHVKNFIEIT